MRAAFKAVLDQSRSLSPPPPWLAFQHYETFAALRGVSRKIDMVSRFRSRAN